jgi:hypothetical protein
MTRKLLSTIILLLFFTGLRAQSDTTKAPEAERPHIRILQAGIKIQKTQKLYWENGIYLDWGCNRLFDYHLHFGFSYVSSRLGSAMGSNAIKQDNYIFHSAWHFRPTKSLQPVIRMNTGYFHADYEDPIFDVLDNTAFIFGLEAGLVYEFDFPMSAGLTVGYTFTGGDGTSGPGTLYPIFYQLSIYTPVFDQRKK